MNRELVEKIVKAMLYEGYMLYPYRTSALKNQQRWNFGVLLPEGHSSVIAGVESSRMQTECLVVADRQAAIRARARFLHLVECSDCGTHTAGTIEPLANTVVASFAMGGFEQASGPRQETVEREVCSLDIELAELSTCSFCLPFKVSPSDEKKLVRTPAANTVAVIRNQQTIEGTLELRAAQLGDQVFKLTVEIKNLTPVGTYDPDSRDWALMRSLISTHTILEISGGEFISAIDPPENYRDAAQACRNIGSWPVLAGKEGERDCMLSSPIILYDYPQVAPESAGDFFDSTEIDEMLTLRVMTLTEEEKQTMREGDPSARRILDRTESMPQEQVMKLHGALRGLREIKREGRR
ncbi:MAG: hypothetical protein GEU77_12410 [Deltaproteobacteria bacterium]|nr:hypothetical protein [Deltaproteobacteria bacterium]